jgi:hypothetical protein
MRWAVHVARRGQEIWWEDLNERDHVESLGVGGRIILKFIFKK